VIELDLGGRTLSVAEDDVEWLRRRADQAAGSSSGATELASRLAAISVNQRRLVFIRAEARTIFNTINAAGQPPQGLIALQQLLQQPESACLGRKMGRKFVSK
jgi:hypothetical protein